MNLASFSTAAAGVMENLWTYLPQAKPLFWPRRYVRPDRFGSPELHAKLVANLAFAAQSGGFNTILQSNV